MTTGNIFNIQKFSLHDGPGIRTTVFFKGCPLKCPWCQNPEGVNSSQVLFRHNRRCLGCKTCLGCCPREAITLKANGPRIDRNLCDLCFICVENCPAGVYEAAGKAVTVAEVIKEISKDLIIYEESGGGVTFSGGEPFLQPEFLLELLKGIKQIGIHTAIETCGHTSWENIKQTLNYTDLYIYDLKLLDPLKCIKYLGVSGEIILDNLSALAESNAAIQVRIPVVPGITDDFNNIELISKLLSDCGIETAELIPYHNLAIAKYRDLDLEYKLSNLSKPQPESYERFKKIFVQAGLKITCEVEAKNE